LPHHLSYCVKNATEIIQDIRVPEAEDREAPRPEPTITTHVVIALYMLTAISFHDDPPLEGDEVNNETADRDLAAEFYVRKPPIAQSTPELALGIGHVLAQESISLATLTRRRALRVATLSRKGRG